MSRRRTPLRIAFRRSNSSGTTVRESAVMGRSAVAVCIACWQIPALGYLFGLTSSSTAVSDADSSLLPFVWSGSFVLSGLLMILVRRLPDETDKAVVEIGALVVFTGAMVVYLAIILGRASSLEGRLAVLALLLSLLINLVGRAALLARQVRFVRALRKERGLS